MGHRHHAHHLGEDIFMGVVNIFAVAFMFILKVIGFICLAVWKFLTSPEAIAFYKRTYSRSRNAVNQLVQRVRGNRAQSHDAH